jgi:hypothetical protein
MSTTTNAHTLRTSTWLLDLNVLPWPLQQESWEEVLGLDVFEHLHLMPEQWQRECYRVLLPRGCLRLRIPLFGTPWHLIDPTHVRGFHPLNFDHFIRGREFHQKYGHYYFEFSFSAGKIQVDGYNILATLIK